MGRNKLIIWNYFIESNKNGKTVYMCSFCGDKFGVKNATKKFRHLLICSKCPTDIKLSLELDHSKRKTTTNPSAFGKKNTKGVSPDKRNTADPVFSNPLHDFPDQAKCSEMLCRAIFATGAPFAIVEHPLWLDFFKCLQPKFEPVSKKLLSTVYLDKEYQRVKRSVQAMLSESKNLHIQCNSWSRPRPDQEYKISVLSSKPVFLKFLSKSNCKTPNHLASQLVEVLREIGPEKFFVLVGDNSTFFETALAIVKKQFKHVTSLSCISHTLQMICEDIVSLPSINLILTRAQNIADSVNMSKALSAELAENVACSDSTKLVKTLIKSRLSSYLACLESLVEYRYALYELNFDDDLRVIVEDETFWIKIMHVISLFQPVMNLVKKYEEHTAAIHSVYDDYTFMEESLQTILSDGFLSVNEQSAIMESLNCKRQKLMHPIHLAASILNPATMGNNLTPEDRLQAMDFIDFVATNMSEVDEATIMQELVYYNGKSVGEWSKPFLWKSANKVPPMSWWMGICGHTQLSRVACRILSAPASSMSEKQSASLWSTGKRIQMSPERQSKMHFIAHNCHLVDTDSENSQIQEVLMPSQACECIANNTSSFNSNVNRLKEENSFKVIKVDNGEVMSVDYEYEWLEDAEYQ